MTIVAIICHSLLIDDAAATTASDLQPTTATVEISEMLRTQSVPLRGQGAPDVQRLRLGGQMAPPTLEALVMMCDFSDSLLLGRFGEVPGDFPPPQQTDRLYAAHDSLFFDHMMSKVSDYYTTVSGGKLKVNYTVHPRVVNLPEPMGFYGNHPEEGDQQLLLAANVVERLLAEIDFTLYDTYILVHAGAGEETDILANSPEQIFSTYLNPDDFALAVEDGILAQPYLPAPGFPEGTGIDRVLILPETEQQDPVGGFGGGFGSLGVYCFEVGLHLGMLSLSDFTPSGRPDSQGIGQYGLMGFGLFVGLGFIPPHPCAYNKLLMGWIDPYEADASAFGTYGLTPANNPESPTASARVSITGQEFWLLEYRLQDPNGDRRYSFADDKNGNGLPDFWDADSETGDGRPTGKFDAATDSLERVIDAEWDFAMSENSARGFGELGWGSGVYVWHIDEGVVLDVFSEPRNLFNADPNRKSVDLEEADGIQDLDSRQPSPFALGGDNDSFRGEFANTFSPTTLPRTDTSGGAYTGIIFSEFSPVVADSFLTPLFIDANNDTFWAFDYADTMKFTLQTELSGAGPVLAARREFPAGVDLRGSHVLLGDLDQLGGTSEIILAGRAG
ncbi:MAG: M6 family metalloprotease-like protein, partial [Candidatus Krumholzibacteriia bacterium]